MSEKAQAVGGRGRFDRPLRDVNGYVLYLAAPVLAWWLNRDKDQDDPFRTSVAELREYARKRPFVAVDAAMAYVWRMMLWVYPMITFLVLSIPGWFAWQPQEARPWLGHFLVGYVPHAGFAISFSMFVVAAAKMTLCLIFGMVQFGRDSEEPRTDEHFIEHLRFLEENPELRDKFDPPASLLGRLLRPVLTPSNVDTAIVLVLAWMAFEILKAM